MKKIIFLLIFVLTGNILVFGQAPDRWHDLVLDQSTADDAIKILGKPEKDSTGPIRIFGGVSKWVSKKQKEKIFRNLEFKFSKNEGVEKAIISCLDDKIVSINLDLKAGSVAPNGLSNIYKITFYPMINSLDIAFFEKNYEQNQGKIYPKTYPSVYDLAAVSEKSFITAMISNVPSILGALGKSMGVPDEPGSFPGKVQFVHLISRTLENKDGANVLK